MCRGRTILLVSGCLTALTLQVLAEMPAPSEYVAVERFLSETEKPPVAYQARRRLEASSAGLKESGWMEVVTGYDPAEGFRFEIVAQGGSSRIRNRALKSVLKTEEENAARGDWRRVNLSPRNYEFNLQGRTSDGMLMMELSPKRRDSRLVEGFALVSADSGHLVKVEGQLSKSPSFWVKWAKVSRTYKPIAGSIMPVSIESTADVRIAGLSTFSMTYDYEMVNGQAVNATSRTLALK
jgi:hypothetical protein